MGSITIHWDKTGTDDIKEKASQLPEQFTTLIDNLKEVYGISIDIYTPFAEGALVAGNIIVDDGQYSFYSDNQMPYYPYVVLGTSSHWIGSPVLISGVGWRYIGEHPGTAPQDFPQWAFDESEGSVDSRCDEFMNWIVS